MKKVKPLSANQVLQLLEKHKKCDGICRGIILAYAEAGGGDLCREAAFNRYVDLFDSIFEGLR